MSIKSAITIALVPAGDGLYAQRLSDDLYLFVNSNGDKGWGPGVGADQTCTLNVHRTLLMFKNTYNHDQDPTKPIDNFPVPVTETKDTAGASTFYIVED